MTSEYRQISSYEANRKVEPVNCGLAGELTRETVPQWDDAMKVAQQSGSEIADRSARFDCRCLRSIPLR